MKTNMCLSGCNSLVHELFKSIKSLYGCHRATNSLYVKLNLALYSSMLYLYSNFLIKHFMSGAILLFLHVYRYFLVNNKINAITESILICSSTPKMTSFSDNLKLTALTHFSFTNITNRF